MTTETQNQETTTGQDAQRPVERFVMMRNTPGPWTINETIFDGATVRWHIASKKYGSVYPICEHVIEECPDVIEQMENARLISKAPDLYEALVIARNWIVYEEHPAGWSVSRIDEILSA